MVRNFLGDLTDLVSKLLRLKNLIDQAELQCLVRVHQFRPKHQFFGSGWAYDVNNAGMDGNREAIPQSARNRKSNLAVWAAIA